MWRFFRAICGLVVVASGATQGSAQPASLDARVRQVAGADVVVVSAIGVTRKGTAIPCLLSPDHNDLDYGKTRVLLVGGMAGSVESVEAVLAAVAWFHTAAVAAELRTRYSVSAVPCVNVDGWPAGLGPALPQWHAAPEMPGPPQQPPPLYLPHLARPAQALP